MDSDILIRALQAYNPSFDFDAVREAYDDPEAGASLRSWAETHVNPDTLLTVDELAQFKALEKSGRAGELAASADLSLAQAFSDQEIKDAIEELERSTAAISKQTETLKQQQDALGRLVRDGQKDVDIRDALDLRQAQKWAAEHKSISSSVETFSQVLDARIFETEQQIQGAGNGLQQTADSVLHMDDKLLSSLQKLGWELETEDPEEQQGVEKLREICARLIKYTVEATRTRLDRIYLESLESSIRAGVVGRTSPDEISALEEELESLYAEVLPVAQMSADQQFLEPALKGLEAKSGSSLIRSEQAVRYIHDCLDYLLDRTEKLSSRIQDFQCHQAATSTMLHTAKAELAVQVEQPPQRPRRPIIGASPTRRRKSSGPGAGKSPVRHRANSGSRRISAGEEPPVDELLRTLALSLQHPASAHGAEGRANAAFLAATAAERRAKAADVAHNVQLSFEGAAVAQMADSRAALQLVRDSVLAESPFGPVRLTDPEIEGSIDVLAQELETVRRRLEEVDAGLAKARGRSVRRDEILRRWGR